MDILGKLAALGVPQDIVDKLNVQFGNELLTELKTNGLKAACEKAGIDATNIPDIDVAALTGAFSELMGDDADGDGKTGIMEAVDTLKSVFTKKD